MASETSPEMEPIPIELYNVEVEAQRIASRESRRIAAENFYKTIARSALFIVRNMNYGNVTYDSSGIRPDINNGDV